MKQIYSTGTLSNLAPQTVRAASAGAGSAGIDAALALSNYAAPRPDAGPPPVRLALFNSPAGRLLTHVTPTPAGDYFAHTILDVPATADAQLAIQTWGSPLWQTRSPDSSADLPDLPHLPVADVLDDAALQAWLAAPARRDLLEFVLTALLGTPADTRIVVAAPAADVATAVYAVTRVLPPSLLDTFSFSTYEADPAACPARLVGHDPGPDDLPEACYHGSAVGCNPATGRKSDLATDVPFAAFAVAKLAAGDFTPLDEVKTTWERFGLNDARQFDLVYRLSRGTGVLTQREASQALSYPPLAAWVSARADALQQFLEWALDDRAFAATSFPRAVQTLRQKPEVTARLAQTVRDAGTKALKAGDLARAANALEVILPTVAPTKANAVWGELLAQLTDPAALGWPARQYLLPRFVRFKQQQGATGVDAALQKWLAAGPDQFADVLALDLPRAYHLAAARAAIGPAGPAPDVTRILARHPALVLTLLQPADGTDPGKLFAALLAEAPSQPWFEQVLANAADYPAGVLNQFFEASLAAGMIDADRVVRTQGPRLLQLFAGQTGLDKLGTQFLAAPPADLLHNAGVLNFLAALQSEPQVTETLAGRIAAVRAIKAYLDAPTFTAPDLAATAAALAVTPPAVPPTAKAELFDAVAAALVGRADGAGLQTDLEMALVHLGPVLAVDSTDLYENLLRDLRTRTDFGRHPNLVPTFLAVALGATKSPELAGKLDGLDGHAFAVASDAARRGGRRLLAGVTRQAQDWPRAARTQWGFLVAAVEPRGVGEFFRDAGLVLAGGVAASAAWGMWLLVR